MHPSIPIPPNNTPIIFILLTTMHSIIITSTLIPLLLLIDNIISILNLRPLLSNLTLNQTLQQTAELGMQAYEKVLVAYYLSQTASFGNVC